MLLLFYLILSIWNLWKQSANIRRIFMNKIPVKVVKKCKGSCGEKVCTNIHSINNQEFRFPSLLTRLKNLLLGLVS
jgi:hypothetical protein